MLLLLDERFATAMEAEKSSLQRSLTFYTDASLFSQMTEDAFLNVPGDRVEKEERAAKTHSYCFSSNDKRTSVGSTYRLTFAGGRLVKCGLCVPQTFSIGQGACEGCAWFDATRFLPIFPTKRIAYTDVLTDELFDTLQRLPTALGLLRSSQSSLRRYDPKRARKRYEETGTVMGHIWVLKLDSQGIHRLRLFPAGPRNGGDLWSTYSGELWIIPITEEIFKQQVATAGLTKEQLQTQFDQASDHLIQALIQHYGSGRIRELP